MHGVGTRRAIRPSGAPRYGQRRFHQVLVAVQVAYEGRRHSFERDGHLWELGDESIPPARKTTSATEKKYEACCLRLPSTLPCSMRMERSFCAIGCSGRSVMQRIRGRPFCCVKAEDARTLSP